MREILFRGKRVDNGEWATGFYTCFNEKEHRIYSGYAETDCGDYYPESFTVLPETVGQYTGFMALNGKVFEHDVVTAKFKSNGARFNFVVKYDNQKGGYIFDNGIARILFERIRSVRVLGNIHDNPELMEGGAE